MWLVTVTLIKLIHSEEYAAVHAFQNCFEYQNGIWPISISEWLVISLDANKILLSRNMTMNLLFLPHTAYLGIDDNILQLIPFGGCKNTKTPLFVK